MRLGDLRLFWVVGGGWRLFYGKWGCLKVYFGWVEIFYRLARKDGGVFWVPGGKYRYILCEWTFFIGERGWEEGYFGYFWWIFFMGRREQMGKGGGTFYGWTGEWQEGSILGEWEWIDIFYGWVWWMGIYGNIFYVSESGRTFFIGGWGWVEYQNFLFVSRFIICTSLG